MPIGGSRLFILAVVHLAVGILFQISDKVLSQGCSIASDFTALNSVPNGDVFILDRDALAGERVDFVGMFYDRVLVLTDVLLTVGVLLEVAGEIATQGSGVSCYLPTFPSVPYGDVFRLLLWTEHCSHEGVAQAERVVRLTGERSCWL